MHMKQQNTSAPAHTSDVLCSNMAERVDADEEQQGMSHLADIDWDKQVGA